MTTPNINCIHLVGRAGSDPEIKFFDKGTKLTKVNVAVRRGKNEQPSWVPLQFWGRLAEVAGDYVKKGDLIEVIGELKLEEWTDSQTGVKRSKPVVNVDKLEMLSSARENDPREDPAYRNDNF
jgi:single-strand DNA-binding protein